jgi:hypothetical protein
MRDWTDDEWENLERLSFQLSQLLAKPDRSNRAWHAMLRITIATIAMYQELKV